MFKQWSTYLANKTKLVPIVNVYVISITYIGIYTCMKTCIGNTVYVMSYKNNINRSAFYLFIYFHPFLQKLSNDCNLLNRVILIAYSVK